MYPGRHTHADTNSHRDGIAHGNGDGDRNTYTHADEDGHRDGHRYCDKDAYSVPDTNTPAHRLPHRLVTTNQDRRVDTGHSGMESVGDIYQVRHSGHGDTMEKQPVFRRRVSPELGA